MTTINCDSCGEVDMSPEAQHLRKVAYGTPVWQDERHSLGVVPMTQEEREAAYEGCPYHVLPNENKKHDSDCMHQEKKPALDPCKDGQTNYYICTQCNKAI